jgi:hypothetical protein
MQTRTFCCAFFTPIVLVTGWAALQCLRPSGPGVPVSGFVVLDGLPLGDADIFFVSEAGNAPVSSFVGRSDSVGEYHFSKGLTPGEYRVVVRKLVGPNIAQFGDQPESDIDSVQLEARMAAQAEQPNSSIGKRTSSAQVASIDSGGLQPLPSKYSSAKDTILRVVVPPEGTDHADLFLSLESTDRLAAAPASNTVQ